MKVIVGLGNPGRSYARTRHNVGFQCVEAIARRHRLTFSQRRRLAVLAEGSIHTQDVVLAKPRTFVNESGRAAAYLRTRFHLSPADLVVILDDLALPVGRVRIRPGGSSGGHNGLESIIAALGTQAFPRIRVGIGPSAPGDDTVHHVLSPLRQEERPLIEEAVTVVADAVEVILTEGIDSAMSRFN